MLQNYSSGFIKWRPESDLALLPSPTAVHRQGPGRSAIVPAVIRALFDPCTCGVLLTGRPGVGKSFITKEVIEKVNGSATVVKLRGSSALAGIDYGVLGPLLGQLSADVVSHPSLLIGDLAELLTSRGGGLPVVLVVENADRVDIKSATVLTQIASARHASLLVVCTEEGRSRSTTENLWGDGALSRFDVEPLTLSETERLLEAEFGRFSRTAVRQAWNLSKGVPRILLNLIDEQIAGHTVAQRDGIWVMTGKVSQHPRLDGEYLTAGLEALTGGRREAAEIVALAGALPMNILSGVCTPDDLDWLQENDYFQISSPPFPVVEFRDSVLAAVVKASVSAARSRLLRSRFLAKHPVEIHPATPSFADWTLDCGEALDPKLGLEAARAANAAGHPEQARRFLEAVDGHRFRAGFIAEELKALMALGDHSEARSLLESQLDRPGWRPQFSEWAELMLLRSSLPIYGRDGADDAIATLHRVWKRLADETDNLSPAELRALRSQLLLAEGTLLADRGRHPEVTRLLTYPYEHGDSDDTDFQLQAGSLLCESWAMAGRHDDALRLAAALELRLTRHGVQQQTIEYVRSRLLIAYLVTAQLQKCEAILSFRPIPGTGAGVHAAEERGIVDGVLQIHHGRIDRALATFLPAISQLREGQAPGVLVLALAGCAYCYAVNDEPEEAQKYLSEISQVKNRPAWFCQQVSDYLEIVTAALLGAPAGSAQIMIDRAENCERLSQPSVQLIFLTGAIRLGSDAAAEKLALTAGQLQGDFAGLCADYGDGILRKDAALLVEVAREAMNAENHSLAQDCASRAASLAEAAGKQALAREAHRITRSISNRSGKQPPNLGDSALAVLTRREREVALAALPGTTNIDISRKLGISVRTVEGHLYQIYHKLHLACREELQALAAKGPTSYA